MWKKRLVGHAGGWQALKSEVPLTVRYNHDLGRFGFNWAGISPEQG